MSDPLGKGFHTLQAMIAIGSGGLFRQGLGCRGTQAHLEFIPERTKRFSSSRCSSEEFGLMGKPGAAGAVSWCWWAAPLAIAHQGPPRPFTRLLAQCDRHDPVHVSRS